MYNEMDSPLPGEKINYASCLRWKTTVTVVGETNSVIYKFTSIGMIRHTYCPIYIHKSSMIINQTLIELYDIRYAQNSILDEDVM